MEKPRKIHVKWKIIEEEPITIVNMSVSEALDFLDIYANDNPDFFTEEEKKFIKEEKSKFNID
jgi:hypothetical protein